jgi:hypothetical protein
LAQRYFFYFGNISYGVVLGRRRRLQETVIYVKVGNKHTISKVPKLVLQLIYERTNIFEQVPFPPKRSTIRESW